MFNGDLHFPVS